MLTFMMGARKRYLKVQNRINQILNLEYFKESLDIFFKKGIEPILKKETENNTEFNSNIIRYQSSLDRCSYETYKEKLEKKGPEYITTRMRGIDIDVNDFVSYKYNKLQLEDDYNLLISKTKQNFNIKTLRISNTFGCYKKIKNHDGYMGWHTNSNSPGYRFYFVYNTDDNSSFMRFINPKNGKMITQHEPKGWSLNVFQIGNYVDPLWHCVYTKTQRFSIGLATSNRYKFKGNKV